MSSGSVLIVDDSVNNLVLLEAIVKKAGFDVRTAEGGIEALERVGEALPDLILLDIVMPDIDGFEVCRRLKADPLTASVPIIFISALDDTPNKLKAFEVGGVDYVSKPISELEVIARVKSHLRLYKMERSLHEEVRLALKERESVYKKLLHSEEKFRSLVENIPAAVFRCAMNEERTIEYISQKIEAITGYGYRTFLLGGERSWSNIVYKKEESKIPERIRDQVAQKGTYSIEYRIIRADGSVRWVHEIGSASLDEKGGVDWIDGVLFDITVSKEAEARIFHLAHHDHLTGLPNRLLLMDRIEVAMQKIKRDQASMALLYLDLNAFKPINDNYGHEMGDRVLQAVAERLLECVRHSDTAARLGGDEFVVLLPALEHPDTPQNVAQKITRMFEKPLHTEALDVTLSFSIGIAIAPEQSMDVSQLLHFADQAMYNAKKADLPFAIYGEVIPKPLDETLTSEKR